MKKKKIISLVIYLCFCLICLITALTTSKNLNNPLYILNWPFKNIGLFIRSMFLEEDLGVIGYFVYIVVGLLPLIYPVYKTIKNKKFAYHHLGWLLVSGEIYFALYYFINPNLIKSLLINSSKELVDIVELGFMITLISLILLMITISVALRINKNKEVSCKYSKNLITAFGYFITWKILFCDIYNLKSKIIQVNSVPLDVVNISKSGNIAFYLFMALLEIGANVVGLVLLYQVSNGIDQVKDDMFKVENKTVLKRISHWAFITIMVQLFTMTLMNFLSTVFQPYLLLTNYDISFDFSLIIVTCLSAFLSQMFIRSIEINEENKLVI